MILETVMQEDSGKTLSTVITKIFIRVKISCSSVGQLSYTINFCTATVVSDSLVYVYGFRMLLNFILSAKSTKSTNLNCVRKFVRLQYPVKLGACTSFFAYMYFQSHTALLFVYCLFVCLFFQWWFLSCTWSFDCSPATQWQFGGAPGSLWQPELQAEWWKLLWFFL